MVDLLGLLVPSRAIADLRPAPPAQGLRLGLDPVPQTAESVVDAADVVPGHTDLGEAGRRGLDAAACRSPAGSAAALLREARQER